MARPRLVTDEEILAAARRCFLEHGPGVSTTVVARSLGISHAVLFQRFGTKEDLLKAALAPPPPPWIADLESGPAREDLRAQLLAHAQRIFAYFEEIVPCVAILRACGIHMKDLCKRGQTPPPLLAHQALAAWLERARALRLIRACDVEDVAHVLLGALQMRPFLEDLRGKKLTAARRAAYIETVVGLVWRGLGIEESKR
jgi:AcrR family transcriptional regulator